jgi:hypothetical protein
VWHVREAARPAPHLHRQDGLQAAARRAKKAARPVHLYEACRDTDCQRLACRAFKEGREEGHREGYRDGHQDGYTDGHLDGYTEGYDRGFPDGIAACPRNHG